MNEQKEKFTPGPWSKEICPDKTYIWADTGNNTRKAVAIVKSSFEVNNEANAALIVAAPEMYEFIQNQCDFCKIRFPERKGDFECQTCATRLLLKKARGEE